MLIPQIFVSHLFIISTGCINYEVSSFQSLISTKWAMTIDFFCFVWVFFFLDAVTTSAPAIAMPRRTTARTTTRAPAGGSCRRPTLWSAPPSCLRSDLLSTSPSSRSHLKSCRGSFVFFSFSFLGGGEGGWDKLNGLDFLQSLLATKGGTYSPLRAFIFVSAKYVLNRVSKWTLCSCGSDWPDAFRAMWRCLSLWAILSFFPSFFQYLKKHNSNICACLYVGSCCCKVYLLHIQTYIFSSLSAVGF